MSERMAIHLYNSAQRVLELVRTFVDLAGKLSLPR